MTRPPPVPSSRAAASTTNINFGTKRKRRGGLRYCTFLNASFIPCTALLSLLMLYFSISVTLNHRYKLDSLAKNTTRTLDAKTNSMLDKVKHSDMKSFKITTQQVDAGTEQIEKEKEEEKEEEEEKKEEDKLKHFGNSMFSPQNGNSSMTSINQRNKGTKGNSNFLDCKLFLSDFRQGKISEIEKNKGYEKPFVTRATTPKPFYWSLHNPDLDPTRSSSYHKGLYYEKELSQRIIDVFENITSTSIKNPSSTSNDHNKNQEQEQAIMLDVGGNLGWFSLLAAAHGASKVYMFEPNPSNLLRFCESLQLNDWLHDDRSQDIVYPIAKGVSDQAGTMKFYRVVENNPGSYSFSETRLIRNSKEMKAAFLAQNRTAIEERVLGEIEVITLDDFAESMGWFETKPRIAFFKLDVEGLEPQIIKGGKKLFESRLVEYFSMEMKPKQTLHRDKRDIIRLMLKCGYELYMHGSYLGPNTIVHKSYDHYKELLSDISARVYFENLLFRKKADWKGDKYS